MKKAVLCSLMAVCLLLSSCGLLRPGDASEIEPASSAPGTTEPTSSESVASSADLTTTTTTSTITTRNSPTTVKPSFTRTTAQTTTKKPTTENRRNKVVRYATWKNPFEAEDGPVLAAFERKHNIAVEIVYAPQGGYIQRLSAYIEAGAAPDVYIDTAFWPATATIAQPIDAMNINTADSFWDAETFRATKVNGKIYGVNGARSVWNEADCMFYNRSLLRGLGIKTPEQYQREGTWNFDAVETILKEVHKNGYIGGFLNPEMLAAAYGADWLRMENGRMVNNSSSATLALVYQKLAEWNQKGYLAQSDGRFLSGDVGLCTGNAFGLKKTGTFSSMNLTHIGFVEMPALDSRISAQPSGLTRFYGLCRGAENPQAAGKFLRYYLDASNYDEKNTFISNDAANFFYSLNSKASKGKSCYYLNGVQELLQSFDHISDYQHIAYDDPRYVTALIRAKKSTLDGYCAAVNRILAQNT